MMEHNRLILVFVIAAFFPTAIAMAALPPPDVPFNGTTRQCVKASFRGDASTYNPFRPGWMTGGPGLATGGRYNPDAWEAALQLGLAKQYGCGYGRGVCDAVVQAPNGRGAILRINDNGPLTPGRVIDLNERSMRYLGGSGGNAGLIRNVTVTLLCGVNGMTLGPLDPNDRERWAQLAFNAPYGNPGYGAWSQTTPVSSAGPVGFPSSYSSPAYVPSPASMISNPSPFANVTPVISPQRPPITPPAPSAAPPNWPVPTSQSIVPPVAILTVQPREVIRGNNGLISWSSVGMSDSSPCRVTAISGGRQVVVGQSSEGSQQMQIAKDSMRGIMNFSMRCVSRDGATIERSAALIVK